MAWRFIPAAKLSNVTLPLRPGSMLLNTILAVSWSVRLRVTMNPASALATWVPEVSEVLRDRTLRAP